MRKFLLRVRFKIVARLRRGALTKLCYSQVFSTSLVYKCEGVFHMIAFNSSYLLRQRRDEEDFTLRQKCKNIILPVPEQNCHNVKNYYPPKHKNKLERGNLNSHQRVGDFNLTIIVRQGKV